MLEEFKDRTNKFYPKKSEINKNFKALELQIKQIYEYIIKKDENSENWLLAKKPIGGFSCASCESYLGDLKENNEKVIWNQLPERDILTTNTNRIGNGFSRILNLVNVSKENNSRNGDTKKNNNLNLSYNSKKNKKFIDINKDNENLNNTEVISNTKKNPIHKTIKSEHINNMNKISGSGSLEKDKKKKLENDERQMFNLYEENDEIDELDSEQLNNIAKIVLDRIQNKLSGTDFNPNIIYDVKNQVNELIKSATSYENLAQSYLGWCPFW